MPGKISWTVTKLANPFTWISWGDSLIIVYQVQWKRACEGFVGIDLGPTCRAWCNSVIPQDLLRFVGFCFPRAQSHRRFKAMATWEFFGVTLTNFRSILLVWTLIYTWGSILCWVCLLNFKKGSYLIHWTRQQLNMY